MKKNLLLLVLTTAMPLFSFAQGCITVFSEDGDRFVLVLNGLKQNPTPQTNVRVDGLPNDYYNAKIIFEDQSKGEITKNVPVKDAATGQFAEMTFKIKKTKDGDMKLRYFSSTPIPVSYNPPLDMYVVHYGQPAAAPVSTVATTTTTSVVQSNPAGVNMNVNAGGMNMSVNMSDPSNGGGVNMNVNMGNPNAGGNVTQTTTTTTSYSTTTTSSDGGYGSTAQPAPAASPAGCGYPMDVSSFNDAKKAISGANFEDTKLSTAKSILNGNCLSADQVIQVCKLFGFEQTKLDFAKMAYPKTTDQGNYFKVGTVFQFDASKTELNNFISR